MGQEEELVTLCGSKGPQPRRATGPVAQEAAFQRAQSKMAGLSQAFLPEPETSRLVLDILKRKDEDLRM